MASRRRLTFQERVGYQYAIEEVYWRHRIWPKENLGPKPPLNAIVSQRQIETRVEEYLRKSQLLAHQRGSPINPSELQAEMERMANHTRQPEVLRELFAALGNDPFVVAECLARPALAEQLVSKSSDSVNGRNRSSNGTAFSVDDPGRPAATLYQSDVAAYTLPEISVPDDCRDDSWTPTTIMNAPSAREGHTAVWTGSEMIIWGGLVNFVETNTGGEYNPALDTWVATNTTSAPSNRWRHSAVWTGIDMIVWGGGGNNVILNTGGRYNPAADSWTATSTNSAPTARISHSGIWTGSDMIVWGGYGCGGNCNWNTGGRYNPTNDSWTPTSTVNAPTARFEHNAQWTGGEMIIWGGSDDTNYLHTGGRYNPTSDSWTPTGLVNVAPGRIAHAAVWTGNEMLVWGGVDETFNDTNTGGRYNPVNDSWTTTTLNSAPSPRDSHAGVWTGSEMIVWGGGDHSGDFNNGGRYNAGTDSWTVTATAGAPEARESHTAVWTGSQIIAWGGVSVDDPQFFLNTGGSYCAQPSAPIVLSAVSQKTHGNAASFGINLPLTGAPGIECRSGGATNDDTIVVTFLANVSVNGNPQAVVTSGVGIVGSGGVSNGGMVTIANNVVTIPLTNVGNVQTINVTLFDVNGSTNVVIPMSILVGDTNSNAAVNASDVSQTKSRIGQQINATNFRSDVNANGYIDAVDIAIVKSYVGTGLP